ncbi:hypothetical protein PV409_36340 [Streptomyces sp. ME02-6979.5a]|uniref:hypothetical protein n=1 Tax=Streptomyces sp. ME02-6979.5a TaxID=462925 RepID=UPI0029A3F9C7|nr:hypothetical protein [Streptomyces sp. ME02-6979.5a]MDX3343431.1 hypothetical protein [Streptomyces sp. ME02-6979.5a]
MSPSPEPAESQVFLATPETWPYLLGTPRNTKLQAWVREHRIDPSNVALDPISTVTTADGTQLIEYTEFLRNAEGHRYVDPENRSEAATEIRRVPLRTAPPPPKRSDITTRAVLQAIHDHRGRPRTPGTYRGALLGAWWTLCTVYPEKVVTAAYEREDDRGYLECGVSLRTSWLTDKGRARLVELRGAPL